MQRYTLQQSIQMIKIHYENSNEKSSWLMRPVSTSMARKNSKFIVMKSPFILNMWLFGAVYGPTILGPQFFENEVGATVTVSGLR